MNRRIAVSATVVSTLFASACHEPTRSDGVAGPEYDVMAAATCPTNPDIVAHDIATLLQAVANAAPGATIALHGMIDVTGSQVIVRTDGVTITCATPGSGLRTLPDAGVDWLLVVFSRNVTVADLVFDATNARVGAVLAYFNPQVGALAYGPRVLRNEVMCGPGQCLFVGADHHAEMQGGALVAGNSLVAVGTERGIQAQGIVGARIEGNTVRATGRALNAIASNGSVDLVVIDNLISGPWETGLHLFSATSNALVQRNRIDGPAIDPVWMHDATDIRLEENTVACGESCLFAQISGRVLVLGNRFTSDGSLTGVHFQEGHGIRGTRIEGNTIVARAASTGGVFGGIRARDALEMVIARNTITGPWANSMAVTDMWESRIEHNDLRDGVRYGISMGEGIAFLGTSIRQNEIRSNDVRGTGIAGLFAHSACDNTFIGNMLELNPQALIFDFATGRNSYVGDRRAVIDNGATDCEPSDGVVDPNILTGPGLQRRGAILGAMVSAAAQGNRYK